MFGIGIIGCGKIAQVRHIPEYAENPDAKLLGFYDINLERARELAEKHGAIAYETVEALLANPDIHAVSICRRVFTPHHIHRMITIVGIVRISTPNEITPVFTHSFTHCCSCSLISQIQRHSEPRLHISE